MRLREMLLTGLAGLVLVACNGCDSSTTVTATSMAYAPNYGPTVIPTAPFGEVILAQKHCSNSPATSGLANCSVDGKTIIVERGGPQERAFEECLNGGTPPSGSPSFLSLQDPAGNPAVQRCATATPAP